MLKHVVGIGVFGTFFITWLHVSKAWVPAMVPDSNCMLLEHGLDIGVPFQTLLDELMGFIKSPLVHQCGQVDPSV